MSSNQPAYRLEGNRLIFPTLRNIGGLDAEVSVTAPKSFGQPNEHGGLRNVHSLEEVCALAKESAQETTQLLKPS
ncbi:MAG: hypothetical protein OXE83_08855 [Gammaproteobacteria bacterium]|nr:hypothetical protein [Gammaproteobacteria bacterium]